MFSNLIQPKFWTKLNELAAVYTARILGAIALLVIGFWIVGRLSKITEKLLNKTQLDLTVISFISKLARFFLMGVTVMIALNLIGVPITSVVALLGTAGLAIALALKDSLKNVAAGLALLTLRPFKVDDYIEVSGTGGTVKEIGFFHATLNTSDNRQIHVPNGKLLDDSIINFSANPTRRIDLIIGIGYSSNLLEAKHILERLIAADTRILKEPEPLIKVGELGESSVNLFARPWVNTEDYWKVRFDLTEQIKLAFDQAGIEIPFPQRQIHLSSSNALSNSELSD